MPTTTKALRSKLVIKFSIKIQVRTSISLKKFGIFRVLNFAKVRKSEYSAFCRALITNIIYAGHIKVLGGPYVAREPDVVQA